MPNTNQLIAKHWDNVTRTVALPRSRWWLSDRITRHVNRIVCGEDIPGFNQGAVALLNQKTKGRTFKRGLSIGCGGAGKELNLMKRGVVEHFDLFELSAERCKVAKEAFRKNGYEQNVNIINQEFALEDASAYDFIHWDNSLHHMFDTDKAIAETYSLLKPGGVFFMNDFIGQSRFQWSEAELEVVNSFRDSLPDEVFTLPNGKRVKRRVDRPDLKTMINRDPSEAADSESIIPSLKKRLDDPLIIPTGGVVYHVGLNDILTNIPEDSPLLSLALTIDSIASRSGLNQYGVCIAEK